MKGEYGMGGIWSAQHFADRNIKRLISVLQMHHWLNIERNREKVRETGHMVIK